MHCVKDTRSFKLQMLHNQILTYIFTIDKWWTGTLKQKKKRKDLQQQEFLQNSRALKMVHILLHLCYNKLTDEKGRGPIEVCRKPTVEFPLRCMKMCPRFFRRRWRGCEPGWSATRSAPHTPPRPPGIGRGWSHERCSAAPLLPCEPLHQLHRGLPHPPWQARAPERRWRQMGAESWTQGIKTFLDIDEEHWLVAGK